MPTTTQDIAFETKRVLGATPDEVFSAWTKAETLVRWFGPTGDAAVKIHELHVHAGGKYRIEMRMPDNSIHIVVGEYITVARPSHLAFTWKWEGKDEEATLVEISIRDHGKGCELTLRHSRFATEASRASHQKGWTGCLSRLSEFFPTSGAE